MAKLRVHNYSMSLDGYVAGPDQSLEEPLGIGAEALHEWVFATPSGRRMMGQDPGDAEAGIDEDFFLAGLDNIGAHVMGRNMFGPVRGPWDEDWRGWWGDEPPYHCPVFVLTHHPRPPIEMKGGTVFHFVTDGIESALYRAKEAAGARDVRIGGGAATIREYLGARLIDEMHVAVSPVVLGAGEPLLAGLDLPRLGYEITEHAPSESATHVVFSRS